MSATNGHVLGDVAAFIRGVTFKPDNVTTPFEKGTAVCMRTKNVQADLDEDDLIAIPKEFVRRSEQFLTAGDLLVSSANSWNLVGKCCWVPELDYDATAGGFISILRADREQVYPRYLYHWFAAPHTQHHVRLCGRQTTNISNLNYERCLKLPIPLPPLEEQKRIAAILDKADAIRRKRQDARVDFDQVALSTYRVRFGDPISSWNHPDAVRFDSLTTRITYGFTQPMEHILDGIPIITAKNVRDGFIDYDNVHYARKDQFDGLTAKSKPNRGDILVTKDGAIRGRSAIVDRDGPICINQSVALIQPDFDVVTSEFLLGYLRSHGIQWKIHNMDKGAAMPHLQITELARFPVRVPTMEAQNKFTEFIQALNRTSSSLDEADQQADALFNSLVQRAFKGEL